MLIEEIDTSDMKQAETSKKAAKGKKSDLIA